MLMSVVVTISTVRKKELSAASHGSSINSKSEGAVSCQSW